MEKGSKHGCLTVLDLGEEYTASKQYLTSREKYDSLQRNMAHYNSISIEEEKRKAVEGLPSSSFMSDWEDIPAYLDRNNTESADYERRWTLVEMQKQKKQMSTYYKCICKCGKVHYYDEKTIRSDPKYCYYPMYKSSRLTYSISSQNATYRKQQRYGDLMNVVFVDKRSDCKAADEYCGLWNRYKEKQAQKKVSASEEKRYTIEEWDDDGKSCGKHEVLANSHLGALKKIYPDMDFELFPQSDIRNQSRVVTRGRDYNFRVSNHYGNSVQYKSRYYKKIKKS